MVNLLIDNILDKNAKTVELTCQNYTDWDTHSDYSGDVLVPAEVVYDNTTYKVVKIGQCAFKTSDVISVTISEGVESIGQVAFERCYELTSISLPSTLTEIEYGVFWNCNGLTSMTLPEGLTTIGNDAFRYCYSLKQLVLPSTLSSIGERAFCNTEALLYLTSRFLLLLMRIPLRYQDGVTNFRKILILQRLQHFMSLRERLQIIRQLRDGACLIILLKVFQWKPQLMV